MFFSLLYDDIQDLPQRKLTSRKPSWMLLEKSRFNLNEEWQNQWEESKVHNYEYELVKDVTIKCSGFNFNRIGVV